jgi:DNA polymerase-1
MPIQGTNADIIKKAMVEVHHQLEASDYDARMLLQVHDELIFEVREDHVEPVQELVCGIMEAAGDMLDVPVKVEARSGKNWLELD